MMIASCKGFDGWALGFDKVGEGIGEREGKFGNVLAPPQPTPKDKFASKPNHLLKPREKPSEKVSEKPSEKPCGEPSEKPCEETHPKPKPRSIRFHCEFCGNTSRDVVINDVALSSLKTPDWSQLVFCDVFVTILVWSLWWRHICSSVTKLVFSS
jgi:hypothetical protein